MRSFLLATSLLLTSMFVGCVVTPPSVDEPDEPTIIVTEPDVVKPDDTIIDIDVTEPDKPDRCENI